MKYMVFVKDAATNRIYICGQIMTDLDTAESEYSLYVQSYSADSVISLCEISNVRFAGTGTMINPTGRIILKESKGKHHG